MKRSLWTILLLLCLGLVGAGLRRSRARPPSLGEAPALSAQLQLAVTRASRGCVAIIDSAGASGERRSGALIGGRLVLTADENLSEGARAVTVIAPDGRALEGRVVGRDLRTRIVGIVLPPPGLPGALERTALLEPGRFAIACGRGEAPADRAAATFGIISAARRFSAIAAQVSCPIDPMNAGGPVVDLEGRCYGIAVRLPKRVNDASGVGFIVPWRALESKLEAIVRGEVLRPAVLGILVPDELTRALGGLPVVAVRPSGPAARAGVVAGDVIRSVNGRDIQSLDDFTEALAALHAGQRAELVIARGGASMTLALTADRRRE